MCLGITFISLLTTNIEPSFNTTRILYLTNPINSATHFVCCSVWFEAIARQWNEMKYNPRFTIYLSLSFFFIDTDTLNTFFYLAPNAFKFILFLISHPLCVCDCFAVWVAAVLIQPPLLNSHACTCTFSKSLWCLKNFTRTHFYVSFSLSLFLVLNHDFIKKIYLDDRRPND